MLALNLLTHHLGGVSRGRLAPCSAASAILIASLWGMRNLPYPRIECVSNLWKHNVYLKYVQGTSILYCTCKFSQLYRYSHYTRQQCACYVLIACCNVYNSTLHQTLQPVHQASDDTAWATKVPNQLLLNAASHGSATAVHHHYEGQMQHARQQSMMQHTGTVRKQHVRERAPLEWVWDALAWRECFVNITSSDIMTGHAWQGSLEQSPEGAAHKKWTFSLLAFLRWAEHYGITETATSHAQDWQQQWWYQDHARHSSLLATSQVVYLVVDSTVTSEETGYVNADIGIKLGKAERRSQVCK